MSGWSGVNFYSRLHNSATERVPALLVLLDIVKQLNPKLRDHTLLAQEIYWRLAK